MPKEERPRERLAHFGTDALSTMELLAILLGHGTQNCSVLQLATELLAYFGSLQKMADASCEELKKVKGIGNAKALQLKAVFGLWHRMEEKKSEILDSPEKVYQLIRSELENQKMEVLMVVLRDVKNHFFHREIIGRGTLTELLLHPREIFHTAIRNCAHNIIVAHNHPSGDPTPSTRDVQMTQILVNAGKFLGIEVCDHLIIGQKSYISFFQKRLICNPSY